MLSIAAFCTCAAACLAVDKALIPGASGTDVVRSIVERIQRSNIFPPDNQLLRRIAYVESKDGTDGRTYREDYYGGIWQVDLIGFRATQDTQSHPGLRRKFEQIQEICGINWQQVQWQDLRKPLYSGLAARLFLSNVPDPIPAASDIHAQGQYWKVHYNSASGAGLVQRFEREVRALQRQEGTYMNIRMNKLSLLPKACVCWLLWEDFFAGIYSRLHPYVYS